MSVSKPKNSSKVIILISANAEWRVIRKIFPEANMHPSPYGEWFTATLPNSKTGYTDENKYRVHFFHGGWGKIAAAGSTQYVIDRWKPNLLVNLGTCGGFEGQIDRGEIILANKTIVYDIIEQMGDYDEHIAHYTTTIDLNWLEEAYPKTELASLKVRRSLLVSGDRDLLMDDIPLLKSKFGAVAGDWESGAIAYVAARNQVRLLILRGVTDLVSSTSGEAYGNLQLFEEAAFRILKRLVEALPLWLKAGNIV